MKIEVNLNKKYFSLILGSILLLASAFVVYAYAGVGLGTPATFGHSGGEVDVNYNEDLSSVQSAVDDLDQRLGALENVVPDDPTADPFISKSRQVMEFEDFLELPDVISATRGHESTTDHPGILKIKGVSAKIFNVHPQDNFILSFLVKADSGSDVRLGLVGGDVVTNPDTDNAYAFRLLQNKVQIYVKDKPIEVGGKNLEISLDTKSWNKYRIQREGGEVSFYINDSKVYTTSSDLDIHYYASIHEVDGSWAYIDYVGLIINDLQREKLNCNTPLLGPSSGYGYSALITNPADNYPGYIPIDIPSACTDPDGCVLKREISKTSGVVKTQYITLVKGEDNKWRVDSQSTLKKNGDSTSSWLFSDYPDSDGSIRFRDDSSIEKDPAKWSFYDNSKTYMQKIYLCTAS